MVLVFQEKYDAVLYEESITQKTLMGKISGQWKSFDSYLHSLSFKSDLFSRFNLESGLFPPPLPNHAGIIRTALANMDREAREHYTVVIQAKDMAGQVGGLSGSTTINITLTDINDNPPKFPQSTYAAVLYNRNKLV